MRSISRSRSNSATALSTVMVILPIHATEDQAMDVNASGSEVFDGGPYVHGIATEAIQLRDDEHVAFLEAIDEFAEPLTLHGRH